MRVFLIHIFAKIYLIDNPMQCSQRHHFKCTALNKLLQFNCPFEK